MSRAHTGVRANSRDQKRAALNPNPLSPQEQDRTKQDPCTCNCSAELHFGWRGKSIWAALNTQEEVCLLDNTVFSQAKPTPYILQGVVGRKANCLALLGHLLLGTHGGRASKMSGPVGPNTHTHSKTLFRTRAQQVNQTGQPNSSERQKPFTNRQSFTQADHY